MERVPTIAGWPSGSAACSAASPVRLWRSDPEAASIWPICPETFVGPALSPIPFSTPTFKRRQIGWSGPVQLKIGLAEDLGLKDGSVDAVVGTLVLCSVDRVEVVLEEVLRVLKPGGRFYFLEHVAAPEGSWLGWLQRAVRPVWCRVLDGCRPDRDTLSWIAQAGFAQLQWEAFQAPLPVVSPHICGFAEKHRHIP